jgi:hypothetical protein
MALALYKAVERVNPVLDSLMVVKQCDPWLSVFLSFLFWRRVNNKNQLLPQSLLPAMNFHLKAALAEVKSTLTNWVEACGFTYHHRWLLKTKIGVG